MKGVGVKIPGAQSYSSSAPGYRAPVRQQPCVSQKPIEKLNQNHQLCMLWPPAL